MQHRIADSSQILHIGARSAVSMGIAYLVVNIFLREFGYAHYLYTYLPFLSTGFDWLAAQDTMRMHYASAAGIAGLSAFIASRHGRYIFDTAAGTLSFPASAISDSNYSMLQLMVGTTFWNHLRMKTIRLQDIDEVTSLNYVSYTRARNTFFAPRFGMQSRLIYALDLIGSMGSVSLTFFAPGKRHHAQELLRQAGKKITVLKGPHPGQLA